VAIILPSGNSRPIDVRVVAPFAMIVDYPGVFHDQPHIFQRQIGPDSYADQVDLLLCLGRSDMLRLGTPTLNKCKKCAKN